MTINNHMPTPKQMTIWAVILLILVGSTIGYHLSKVDDTQNPSMKSMHADKPMHTDNMEMNNKGPGMMSNMNHASIMSEEQFIREMIPHHQEAIDTSKDVIARLNDEQVKELANDIITTQAEEIKKMQKRLSERYPGSTGSAMYQKMMPNLSIVSGQSLKMLYLQGMVIHHQGAVAMAYGVLALNPREEVKKFANDIITLQSQEINLMYDMMNDIVPDMRNPKNRN